MHKLRGALTLGACLFLTLASDAAADGFNLIVNAKNPVAGLSKSDIKRLMTGDTKLWEGAGIVQVGIIPGDAPETEYLAALLEMSPRELVSLMQQQVFKGDLRRPVLLRSSGDCVSFAAISPGAFCVASSTTVVLSGARAVPLK